MSQSEIWNDGYTIPSVFWGEPGETWVGDFNGDGKTDIATAVTLPNYQRKLYVKLSTGKTFLEQVWLDVAPYWGGNGFSWVGDFNGDGKNDIVSLYYGQTIIYKSNGMLFSMENWSQNGSSNYGGIGFNWIGDFNGDGKADIASASSGQTLMFVRKSKVYPIDLLVGLTNSAGGSTTVGYTPSSNYINTFLPFIVPLVSSINTNDGLNNISTTNYFYEDGYFDSGEREFRGFGYAKQINPNFTTVETWFHQDNVFKGLVDKQEVRDSGEKLYIQDNNSYLASQPWAGCVFPYLRQRNEYLYDGTPNYKHVASLFEYDIYGNVTRKYNYGDVEILGDERDDRIEYYYDTTKWIISQPSRTYVMDNSAVIKAQSWFAYDSASGNLLSKTDWLSGGTNPVTSFTYNSYGNRITTTHPTMTIGYDSTYTYPTSVTNALNQVASKTYDYRYGAPLTETDINGNTTTYEYDVFGRSKKVISPFDNTSSEGTRTIYYENFGQGVGNQRVAIHSTEQSGTGNYLWGENYFDGFGRTIKSRREGPDGKVIVTQTIYDTMGRVSDTSLPYFEGLETPRWVSYEYDPIGRVTMVVNPDNTYATKNYALGTAVSIDANGHKKEADSDAYGQLREVREYTGTYPDFTLYATTSYSYDVLGNLDNVIDTAGHVTNIGYDTLSRKTSMTDPDMGYWTYAYDANGNLTSQTDAKGQTIISTYDALDRITNKDYPAGTDVVYTYDQTFSTNYKGRLTTVTDASGTTKFYYDKLGRITKTIKTVSGVNYTIEWTYDVMGRTTSIKYPDTGGETVSYTYGTGGNLSAVGGYATYSNYNALGQAGLITYGNGATTTYQYYSLNNRLLSITTNSQGQERQNLAYAYDNVGNIQTITDLLDFTRTQDFQYDDLNRLTQAQSGSYGTITHIIDPIGNITFNSQVGSYSYNPTKPHAVVQAGVNTYSYDLNGNMTGRLGVSLTYDYENRVTKYGSGGKATTFVYDYAGSRVKKTKSSVTTIYIGNLYECRSGTCTKYVFAEGDRIASKNPTNTFYYHTDHLRSSSVITDASGAKVEEIYYFPFGATRFNSGSVNLKHKYTGKEEDAETGLYYYGARYYDPAIGRFITADSLVPSFSDPQSLNRYNYARNNPLVYRDPTGQAFIIDDIIIGAIIGAMVGGVTAAITGNDVGKGMMFGAISGAIFGAGGYIASEAATTAEGLSSVTQVGIHTAAGAVSGGINSAISGDNIGMGMLIGGISGGISKYAGGFLPDKFGYQLAGRTIIGGVTGGISAEIYGGNFRQGFAMGARTGAIGFLANEMHGKFITMLQKAFKGSEMRFYTTGVWTQDTTLEVDLGQIVEIKVKNLNILGTTISIEPDQGQTQELILMPQKSQIFKFGRFGNEPMRWRFDISSQSDAFSVFYEVWSTWIPGMPANR